MVRRRIRKRWAIRGIAFTLVNEPLTLWVLGGAWAWAPLVAWLGFCLGCAVAYGDGHRDGMDSMKQIRGEHEQRGRSPWMPSKSGP